MVGALIGQIRLSHGDTLRSAARRTGLEKTTLWKLEHDKLVRYRPKVLRAFAAAYGIDPDLLLRGDNPAGALMNAVQAAPPAVRAVYTWADFGQRVSLTLDFVLNRASADLTPEQVARKADLTAAELQSLHDIWQRGDTTPGPVRRVAAALVYLTSLPNSWFTWGVLGDEPGFDGWNGVLERVLAAMVPAQPQWDALQRVGPIDYLRRLVEAE